MPTYNPQIMFVRGKDARLWDDDGNEYLYDKIDAKQLSDAIYACPEFTSRDTFLNTPVFLL